MTDRYDQALNRGATEAGPKVAPTKNGQQHDPDAAYDAHPICLLLPDMSADDFAGLKRDIEQHGLRHPIMLFENRILDGRHRARACNELGIVADYQQWSGSDPIAFVLAENLHRRHLNAGQRAMIAAQAMDLHKAAAQARMTSGKTLASGDATPPASGKAAGTAAAAGGVSQASVERAIKVTKEGTSADVRDVTSGKTPLKAKVREIAARKPKTAPAAAPATTAATGKPKRPTAKEAMQRVLAVTAALVALDEAAGALAAGEPALGAMVAALEQALARYRPMRSGQEVDRA